MTMLLLAAALLASPPQNDRVPSAYAAGATAHARAMVRIVSGVRLRLGHGPLSGEGPPPRDTVIHSAGGDQPANLIEFE